MNLYLLWQNKNNGYDTFDSVVVSAETEEEAKNIHPYGDGRPVGATRGRDDRTWAPPEHVTVNLIGIAIDGTEKGVILASFNAG